VRARDDARGDLMSARHRVFKLLLRQGIVYSGGKAWTGKHELWLRSHTFTTPGRQSAYDAAFDAMVSAVDRRDRRDEAIVEDGRRFGVHPGGDPAGVSARGLHVDRVRVGRRDRRLATPERALDRRVSRVGAHRVLLGLHAPRAGVTKTGNGHARRLLVEAAWHHRPRYRPGRELRRRWETASPAARARGQAANRRLNTRWAGFDARKKRPVVANAAIARELGGWCWSLAVLDD
jgi:transposase